MAAGRQYEFGEFRLDAVGRVLFRSGELLALTPKAIEVLTLLVEHAGNPVGKEELIQKVWADTIVEEGSLTFHVSMLRKALGDNCIETIPKRGYRFVAPLKISENSLPTWQGTSALLAAVESVDETKTAPSVETPHELIESRFKLSERVCRKLNRATLDPRIMGDDLRYADNQVQSDVLVFFLHGLGLDHRDFEPILARLPYRGVGPTLYGWEPDRQGRISLPLAHHVIILREWLREIVQRCQATTLVMVGFSLGADMGFELLLGPTDEPGPSIDAFLSLECNLSLDTCFISRVLAGLSPEHPEISVAELRQLGDSARSLDEWLNIHEYLVRVLRKFQGDIGVLQRAATDMVRPLQDAPGFQAFARWLQGATERVRVLRLVFSNASRSVLAQLRLDNLDSGILGGEFPESAIRVSAKADHFDMISTQYLLQQINELVADLQAPTGRRSREQRTDR